MISFFGKWKSTKGKYAVLADDDLVDKESSRSDTPGTVSSTSTHSSASDLETTNKTCEEKAALTKTESEQLVFSETTKEQKEGMTLFNYFIKVIEQENKSRNILYGTSLYNPKILIDLISKLHQAKPTDDIKKLVRTYLNEQDNQATRISIGQSILIDDIRASLNEKLGFQPVLPRPSKTTMSSISEMNGTDPYGSELKDEQHNRVEKAVDELIKQQKPISDEEQQSNDSLRFS